MKSALIIVAYVAIAVSFLWLCGEEIVALAALVSKAGIEGKDTAALEFGLLIAGAAWTLCALILGLGLKDAMRRQP